MREINKKEVTMKLQHEELVMLHSLTRAINDSMKQFLMKDIWTETE